MNSDTPRNYLRSISVNHNTSKTKNFEINIKFHANEANAQGTIDAINKIEEVLKELAKKGGEFTGRTSDGDSFTQETIIN